MDDDVIECTPPELREIANNAIDKLVPTKSKVYYEKEYKSFLSWCEQNNASVVTENVLLAYFENLSKSKKSSTLWTKYSMLRTMLNIRQNIDISKFARLQGLLKRSSEGYEPKKSKILQAEDIEKFVTEAPDDVYLIMKIVLIMGYCGACRREELTNMLFEDIQFKSDSIIVSVPKTKTNVPRLFVITRQEWINLIKKYVNIRTTVAINIPRFFLNYRNGKCTSQPIGINKIGQMPKVIATYLKLANPNLYSGHCFRRSSASHLANNGGDLLTIKRHGGWKSSTVAEGYVEASLKKKTEVANMLSTQSEASTPLQVECNNKNVKICSSTTQNLPSGCSNWQPDGEMDSSLNIEDSELYLQHKALEDKNFAIDEDFKNAFNITYPTQRLFLNNMNNCPTIKQIKDKYPFLLTYQGMRHHYQKLMGQDIDSLTNTFNTKGEKILNFGISKKFINSVPSLHGKSFMIDCIKILTEYFKEDLKGIILSADKKENFMIQTMAPCIGKITTTNTETGDENETYIVYIEKEDIGEFNNFMEAFQFIFAAYYVFNMAYPKECGCTMEFIQRYCLKTHPHKGTKNKTKTVSLKIISLINKLRVGFE